MDKRMKEKSNILIVKSKYKKRRDNMATQIAPTPTVKGRQAMQILSQLNRKPSDLTRLGADKIISMFEKKNK